MVQLILRFLAGAVFVCLFALLGDSFKPKSFSGLFGAAPSIALAGFAIAWWEHGAEFAQREARSMVIGSLAMILYSGTCAVFVRGTHTRPWLAASILWIEWLFIAFSGYWSILR